MSSDFLPVPYFHVDAFASRAFAGNPAGVCLLHAWLPDERLRSVAAENNLSETAFVVPLEDGFGLRWFTPSVEVDLCGHATLAAAHVLFAHCDYPGECVRFDSRSGRLAVEKKADVLTLDFPARPMSPCEPPGDLLAGLGRRPAAAGKARDYVAVFESEGDVRSLKPDMAALARLDSLGVIATAPGEDCDFVSRFFAPQAGIPEDPVTGSAHCTLVPFWAERLGRSRLHARQVSARGGELFCESKADRVRIGGRAVTYASGVARIPSG